MIPDKIEQIEQMRLGVDYRFSVKIRGYHLLLRPLSISEEVQVASSVTDRLSQAPKHMMHVLTEHHMRAKETLILASTSDVGVNDPKITEYVVDRMTPDELSDLFKQYRAGVDRCNPTLELLKPEDVTILIDEVKKNVSSREELALRLIELSPLHLVSVLSHSLLSTSGD